MSVPNLYPTGKLDLCILTKNSVKTLPNCLYGIIRAKIPINRLIIVDGGSTDSTLDYISSKADLIHRDSGIGVGNARQEALDLIETDFFCFVDSDAVLCRDWWKIICNGFENFTAVCSGVPLFGFGTPIIQEYYLHAFLYRRAFTPSLSNCVINTDVAKKVGGFNRKMDSGEDLEFAKRILDSGFNWKINYNAIAIQHRTLREDLEHLYWWSKGSAQLGYSAWEIPKRLYRAVRQGIKFSRAHPALILYHPFRILVWSLGFAHWCKELRKDV